MQRKSGDAQQTMISSGHLSQYNKVCCILFGVSLQKCPAGELKENNEVALLMSVTVIFRENVYRYVFDNPAGLKLAEWAKHWSPNFI